MTPKDGTFACAAPEVMGDCCSQCAGVAQKTEARAVARVAPSYQHPTGLQGAGEEMGLVWLLEGFTGGFSLSPQDLGDRKLHSSGRCSHRLRSPGGDDAVSPDGVPGCLRGSC